MKTERLAQYISDKLDIKVKSLHSVAGGDISAAYKLEANDKNYFIKANNKQEAERMFKTEMLGLQEIEKSNTIAVPHVHLVDKVEDTAFILMDFVESRKPNSKDYKHFGRNMAAMHQVEQDSFGFAEDNFIGSLPQSNKNHADWAEFYWAERIESQLKFSLERESLKPADIPEKERVMKVFNQVFGDVKPVLLHGDLWGGNYLIATDGSPVLIDPAVYYGHFMVDIAMTKLFGGYDKEFYDAYHEIHPKPEYYNEQIALYQLYYLLVHLNLFGSSYRSSVVDIMQRFF